MNKPPTVPISTYRVQFSPTFRFTDGEAILPYLDALGVGTLYASPYFKARPGSTHGYDVVDHNALNPEIGTEAEQRSMIAAAQRRGMGHLIDFVPNHMGIGADNPWWWGVLKHGRNSSYAHFFDIDWHHRSSGRGKVVIPVLGDHYGRVIERREFTISFDAGTFTLHYYDHRFPLAPSTYVAILETAASLGDAERAIVLRDFATSFGALRGKPREGAKRAAIRDRAASLSAELARQTAADPGLASAIEDAATRIVADPNKLDALLSGQAYRLAFWRIASDEINYRRFFDINDLAGLRVEDAEVLARTHELVFAMIADGRTQGLRIDHIDGLANPGGYANFLVDRGATLGQPLYLVVEKILGEGERLRASWRIAGTTGYDFMNLVAGLFVDPAAEPFFNRLYARVLGRSTTFAEQAYEAKRRIMRVDLASELHVLADALTRIARSDRRSSDYTTNGLREALAEVIAAFNVYRTYVIDEAADPDDLHVIAGAIARAKEQSELADREVFDFIGDVLSARITRESGTGYDRTDVLRFAMRFQQYTGPVTAKSLEDTAFYRYVRLAALNEVGGDPARFGRGVNEFHRANTERAARYPHAMLATATHDHKRGEDTRLRMAALTEFPAEWSRAIARWARMNGPARERELSSTLEYLFYQTVVGTLLLEDLGDGASDPAAHAVYADRLVTYAIKAAREAKRRTSWTDPNTAYEAKVEQFVRTALAPETPFLRDARAFTAALAPVAAVHGLAQVALKLMSPGMPDTYQGCELWDFSLVDPDNRRAVDYARRAAMLASFERATDRAALVDELLDRWRDGGIKLYVTWRLLHLRRERRETFLGPEYNALTVSGSDRIVAFSRDDVVVIVPRLVRSRTINGGLRLRGGDERVLTTKPGLRYVNTIDGTEFITDAEGTLGTAEVLARAPVAVLVPA